MQDVTQYEVLVMGIGNILWADEGFGVRAVERYRVRCESRGALSREVCR